MAVDPFIGDHIGQIEESLITRKAAELQPKFSNLRAGEGNLLSLENKDETQKTKIPYSHQGMWGISPES